MTFIMDVAKLFKETRRIVVAEQQHIVFAEFLPKLIGLELVEKHHLMPKRHGYFTGNESSQQSDRSVFLSYAIFNSLSNPRE